MNKKKKKYRQSGKNANVATVFEPHELAHNEPMNYLRILK